MVSVGLAAEMAERKYESRKEEQDHRERWDKNILRS
jgi:hypothetical protein